MAYQPLKLRYLESDPIGPPRICERRRIAELIRVFAVRNGITGRRHRLEWQTTSSFLNVILNSAKLQIQNAENLGLDGTLMANDGRQTWTVRIRRS
jgi:hypothetical protein